MAARVWLALALVAGAYGYAMADDASTHKVECDRLSFTFEAFRQADEADCYRFTHSEASGNDGVGEYTAVYEHMLVYQGAESIRILSGRAVQNVYFTRQPLSSYIKEFDELQNVGNWESDDDYEDYRVARFSARLDKEDAVCFGFLAEGARVISARGSAEGAGSFLVGYDCQFGSGEIARSLIEHTLSEIR